MISGQSKMGIKCQTCEVLGMSTFTSIRPTSFCRDVREVKRLMTDPPELCCPVSKELMEDPVVAGDGFLGL